MLARVNKSLSKYLPKGDDAVKKAMRYSVLSGGKRARPIIAIEAAKLCGGKLQDVMPVACAIEFVHAYSLIHDDLPAMDNDDFRRGKATCHKIFGEADAILAGDALLTLAFGVIAEHLNPGPAARVISELSKACGADGMVLGQSLDLGLKNEKKDKKILNRINALKTAALFGFSAKAGAIVAGATAKKAAALERFGTYLGLSFQCVDDCLDGESSSRKHAEEFVKKAKAELKIFGKKADTLKYIADRLLTREK